MRGGGGQLVRLPDDEGVEGVALVERLGVPDGGGHGRFAGRRCHEEVHLGPLLALLLDAEDDLGGLPEEGLRQLRKHAGVLGLVPLDGKLIRGTDHELRSVQGYRRGRLQPGADCVFGKLTARIFENAFPGFFGGQRHRDS
jgi:hypothetical protein